MADAGMPTPIVEMRGINKSFGPVNALIDVDLTLYPGEVLGLGVGGFSHARCLSSVIELFLSRQPLLQGDRGADAWTRVLAFIANETKA